MKTFDIPILYQSSVIKKIKDFRRSKDKMKKDFSPTILDFGSVSIVLARHFGFCFGVENAIEKAYKVIAENSGKRIFFLSEMIHNPDVNADLESKGVQFLMDTFGNQKVPWETLTKNDIVMTPAFGTTVEIEKKLHHIGIQPELYDTTCPFVERVWNKSKSLSQKKYTSIIHGKPDHEETRATFSHAKEEGKTLIVKDLKQTLRLIEYLFERESSENFYKEFKTQYSEGFDLKNDLIRVGVVNQTTMLASDTQEIARTIKEAIREKFQLTDENLHENFADTRDTLCYATNDNQTAASALLAIPADLAIVVGGYKSSNTTHLVELCEQKLPSYFIDSFEKISLTNTITHFDWKTKKEKITTDFIPIQPKVTIALTCGASCPDAVFETILNQLLCFFSLEKSLEKVIFDLIDSQNA